MSHMIGSDCLATQAGRTGRARVAVVVPTASAPLSNAWQAASPPAVVTAPVSAGVPAANDTSYLRPSVFPSVVEVERPKNDRRSKFRF